MRHLILIPAFDEVGTIAEVVTGARDWGPVLVVDDGSGDGTAAVARAAGATVLRLARRRGKGAALRAGVAAARARGAERVITLDGDGQHEPRDIARLLAAARRAPRALVVGRRPPAATARGRWNACRVAGFFIDWITGVPVRDTQSGFRSYPVELFDRARPGRPGFGLETELLVAAARAGHPILEIGLRAGRPPVRPSRFHPLADGLAIGTYLAVQIAARSARELGAAARDLARVLGRPPRGVREAARTATAAGHPRALQVSAVAVGGRAAWLDTRGLRAWWRDPRRQRLALALQAIAVSPALLAAAALAPVLGRVGVDLVTPLVNRFYSQDRLAVAMAPEPLVAVGPASEAARAPSSLARAVNIGRTEVRGA